MRASEERVNAVITLALTTFHLLTKLLLPHWLYRLAMDYTMIQSWFTCTFSHFADAFIQIDIQLGNT